MGVLDSGHWIIAQLGVGLVFYFSINLLSWVELDSFFFIAFLDLTGIDRVSLFVILIYLCVKILFRDAWG